MIEALTEDGIKYMIMRLLENAKEAVNESNQNKHVLIQKKPDVPG